MATKAKAAKGTMLKRGDGGGSETFTTIGEVKSFHGPNRTAPAIAASSFDSTADEVIAGLPNSGEVSFEMNWVGSNGQQQGLETDRTNGTLRNFQIVLNDHASSPSTFAFSALVTALDIAGDDPNSAYKSSCTLTISGAPTITYAPT